MYAVWAKPGRAEPDQNYEYIYIYNIFGCTGIWFPLVSDTPSHRETNTPSASHILIPLHTAKQIRRAPVTSLCKCPFSLYSFIHRNISNCPPGYHRQRMSLSQCCFKILCFHGLFLFLLGVDVQTHGVFTGFGVFFGFGGKFNLHQVRAQAPAPQRLPLAKLNLPSKTKKKKTNNENKMFLNNHNQKKQKYQ